MRHQLAGGTVKTMVARYAGRCGVCKAHFPAGTLIVWQAYGNGSTGAKHADVMACEAEKAKAAVQPVTPAPTLNLKSIVTFISAARERGLKWPKLRVLDTDGQRELRLTVTVSGAAPGTVNVKRGDDWIGGVRPNGQVIGGLAHNPNLQAHLVAVAADPAAAAKRYAAVMCQCCFCAKPLTDAGSVEVGYGPVCAKHWGLPHSALGTPTLRPVPTVLVNEATPAGHTRWIEFEDDNPADETAYM